MKKQLKIKKQNSNKNKKKKIAKTFYPKSVKKELILQHIRNPITNLL